MFVGKYTSGGALIWAEAFPSVAPLPNSTGNAYPNSFVVDKDGNISIAGSFDGETLDADPGPGIYNLTPQKQDGFIIHLDTNGNFLWAYNTGKVSIEGSEQVAADSQDNVIVTSTSSATTVVGDSIYTSPNETDYGLIIKYSPQGAVLWSVCIQNQDPQINQRMDGCGVDSRDNIIVSGLFNYTINFNPLGAAAIVNAPGRRESFIAKYSPSGILSWIDTANTNVGVIYNGYHSIIDIDSQDNIYFDSPYEQFATFGSAITLNGKGILDICFAKYSPSGVLQFVKSIGAPSVNMSLYKTVTDNDNNIYMVGEFSNTVNFNPNPGTPKNLQSPAGRVESYIAEYDPNGNYVYAFGIDNAGYGFTIAHGLAVDGNGDIYAGGQFCSTVNFDPTGCSTFNMTASGSRTDGFFVQYALILLTNDVITAPPVTDFCTNGTPGAITGNTPSGGVGGYTYQWQNSADSVTFVNIPGADSINYTPPALTTSLLFPAYRIANLRRIHNQQYCRPVYQQPARPATSIRRYRLLRHNSHARHYFASAGPNLQVVRHCHG